MRRLPFESEDLIGTICICNKGIAGLVTGKYSLGNGRTVWTGKSVRTGSQWQSVAPIVIQEKDT